MLFHSLHLAAEDIKNGLDLGGFLRSCRGLRQMFRRGPLPFFVPRRAPCARRSRGVTIEDEKLTIDLHHCRVCVMGDELR